MHAPFNVAPLHALFSQIKPLLSEMTLLLCSPASCFLPPRRWTSSGQRLAAIPPCVAEQGPPPSGSQSVFVEPASNLRNSTIRWIVIALSFTKADTEHERDQVVFSRWPAAELGFESAPLLPLSYSRLKALWSYSWSYQLFWSYQLCRYSLTLYCLKDSYFS